MRASAGVLLALAGLLALPAPAAAQTEVWSGTLTVGELLVFNAVVASGYSVGATGTNPYGSLSDDDFDLLQTSYTVNHLHIVSPNSDNKLEFILDTAPGDNAALLTLHLGSNSFLLSDATVDASGVSFVWTGHGLSWSDGDSITVSLSKSNAAPDFGADSTTREVAENSPAGTNVGDPVTATDTDTDTLTYSLEGTDAASFQIVSTSGQIQTRSGVTYDYETKSSYSVTVKADDGLGGTDTIAVAIDLTDVNEPPPAIDNVALTSDPGADETYAIGDTVTATVTFDRAVAVTGTPQLTLRVGGGDLVNLKPANYASGSGTTTLRFAYVVQMDDEDTNGIYLEADELALNGGTITGVSDGLDATLTYSRPGQQSDQKVDGVRPRPTAAAVPQNGGTLTVTFTETLSSTTAGTGPFAVTAAGATRPVSSVAASGSTVTLTLASAIAVGQAVSVTYTDPSAGNDGAAIQDAVGNDAATFTQTVTNNSTVVSAAPDFGADTATREVAENSAAGTDVGAAVTAIDVDPLTYTLGGTDAGSFQIVSTSGQIRTRAGRTYNHEAKNTYAVTVTADDHKEGTDTIAVTITVTDEDEQPARPARPRVSAAAGDPPSLEVRWSAPGLNGGPVITGYDVQYREGDDGDWIVWPHPGTDTSTTISGLTADPAAYQVQVRADNDELQSEWSPPGRIRTTPPPPPPPEPVPALPLLGHLLLALGLTAAGARVMHRRPRVPPVA